MAKRTGNSVAWVLVAILAVAIGLLLWRPWEKRQPSERGNGEADKTQQEPSRVKPAEIDKLAEGARKLHQQGHWCDAEAAWQNVLDTVGDQPAHVAIAQEARENLKIDKAKCQPLQPAVDSLKIPAPDKRPSAFDENQIARFYKPGKTVHSVAYLNVTGNGTNKNWILKGTANFAYQYRVVVETKVVENRGTSVVFEQYFQDVSQLRAESKKELELNPPDSPILTFVWTEAEKNGLDMIPPYVLVKRAAGLVNIADPRLKKTLSYFYNTLRHRGGPLMPDDKDDIPLVEKISELTGQRVRIEYRSGLGVTEITVLDGKKLPHDDLERLAYSSSLLMDYFLAEGAAKGSDGPFTIKMADLGGVFGLFNFKTSGELQFKKSTPADRNSERVDIIQVVGGTVAVDDPGANRTGRITPLPGGFVHYSGEKLLVRQARVSWHADAKWFTEQDSLLWGTEKLRNAKMETYYEADVVELGKE